LDNSLSVSGKNIELGSRLKRGSKEDNPSGRESPATRRGTIKPLELEKSTKSTYLFKERQRRIKSMRIPMGCNKRLNQLKHPKT
jgi:hypothetical protein